MRIGKNLDECRERKTTSGCLIPDTSNQTQPPDSIIPRTPCRKHLPGKASKSQAKATPWRSCLSDFFHQPHQSPEGARDVKPGQRLGPGAPSQPGSAPKGRHIPSRGNALAISSERRASNKHADGDRRREATRAECAWHMNRKR